MGLSAGTGIPGSGRAAALWTNASKHVRVAILSEYFYPDNSGGTPTDLSDLARALKAHYPEFTIEVITSRNLYRSAGAMGPLPRFEHWGGLEIKRLRVPRSNRPSMLFRLFWGGVFAAAALLELSRRPRYDLVFVVTNPPALAGAAWLWRKLTRVPYLYLVHDLYPDIAVSLGRLKAEAGLVRAFKALQFRWLRDAARVVVLGRCMQRHLIQSYGLAHAQVAVIPSWGAAVVGETESTNEFRRQLDFPGLVALYAGNFSEYAKIDLYLEAAHLLRDRRDVLFVLIGDGSRRIQVEHEITARGLANVRLLPKVSREMMGQVLAACDVALISLDQRMLGLGVPSKLYTILAAARPILAVVPAGSEVALVIEEEHCGVNITDSSPAAIARELGFMADSRDRLSELGRNSRRALEGKYTIENACSRFRTIFSECAPHTPGRI